MLLGNLIQVTHERSRQSRSRLGSLGGKVESKKEGVRQCFLFTKHLLITSRTSGGKLHFAKVSQRHHSFTKMELNVFLLQYNRPYAYDVTEGRPAALGVKRGTATCVIAKHAARGATPALPHRRAGPPGPRTERLSANAHCQHNTCALRDTSLAPLLWRRDPL